MSHTELQRIAGALERLADSQARPVATQTHNGVFLRTTDATQPPLEHALTWKAWDEWIRRLSGQSVGGAGEFVLIRKSDVQLLLDGLSELPKTGDVVEKFLALKSVAALILERQDRVKTIYTAVLTERVFPTQEVPAEWDGRIGQMRGPA